MEITKGTKLIYSLPYDNDTGETLKEIRNGNLISWLYESRFRDVVEMKKAFLDKQEGLCYMLKQGALMTAIMNGTDTKEGEPVEA